MNPPSQIQKKVPRDRAVAVYPTTQRWIAVLGRRDEPTDALEDYCHLLAGALREKGCSLEILRIPWAEQGWRRTLRDLDKHVVDRRDGWALVQYTSLSWSRKGLSGGFVRLIRYLKRTGINVAIVFHDPYPFGGHRLQDYLRRWVQSAVMRSAARLADKIVSTISPDCVPWMQAAPIRAKVLLVPVGSHVSAPRRQKQPPGQDSRVVVVFGVTENRRAEAALIARVVLRAAEKLGRLRLMVFGRGAKLAEAVLHELLAGSQVDYEVFGLVSREQAGAMLANADVELFVRYGLSSRRTTAIAGIACGLPIVGFTDGETSFPVTEAGVRLVPVGDTDGLVRELVSVLQDDVLREALCERSREAAQRYFSWEHIAELYLSAMR
jgi:glycosyltransferase involved in cell wall biosynthesis